MVQSFGGETSEMMDKNASSVSSIPSVANTGSKAGVNVEAPPAAF